MPSPIARFAALAGLLILTACANKPPAWQQAPAPADSNAQAGAPAPTRISPELQSALDDALRQALRASGREKAAAAAPSGTQAVVDDLVITAQADGSADFAWSFRNPGDYDQNGQVNISDLTPVGISFGKTDGAADWAKHEPVDGDSNGAITIADVTPIGQNFNRVLSGYELQSSNTPANEASWQSTGAEASLASAQTPAGGGRKTFALTLPSGEPSLVDGTYFRVVPFEGLGAGRQYGQAGVSVQYHSTGPPPPENIAPIAVLQVEPQSGIAPLTVLLDGGSSGDIDGVIVKYEVDFNGPIGGAAWENMGPAGVLEHIFDSPGDYLCALRVTDDAGATDTDLALVKVRTPSPPTAALTAETLSGPCPLHVVWDASGSLDPDGLVVKYEWDFNDDGEYEYDSGGSPTADFYYYEPGDYPVSVRVSDADGLQDSTDSSATATDGATWHVQNVPPPTGMDALANCTVQLLDIGGRPGACFGVDDNVDDPETRVLSQVLVRGIDEQASAWDTPTLIPSDTANQIYSIAQSSGGALGMVNGLPAYANLRHFWLAKDADGTLWNDPVEAFGQNWSLSENLATTLVMQGRPVLLSPNGLVVAQDSLGQTWFDPLVMLPSNGSDTSGLLIGTTAFCAFTYATSGSTAMFLFRSLSADGSLWSAPISVDSSSNSGIDPEMVDAGGHPAVFCYDSVTSTVKFFRAQDAEGKHWGSPQILALSASNSIAAAELWGRPAVVYRDLVGQTLRIRIANQAEAASWGLPMQISSDGLNVSTLPAASALIEVEGVPSVLYKGQVTDPVPPVSHIAIRFAGYW